MPDVVDEAVENQKRNVELRTGRAFDSWVELARASGPEKHGELVAWLKARRQLGHAGWVVGLLRQRVRIRSEGHRFRRVPVCALAA